MTGLSSALDAALALQRSGEDLEVYGVHRRSTTVRADTGGEIRQVDHSEIVGLGVRLVRAERSGYASTTDFTQAGLSRCVDQARSHAALNKSAESDRLPSPTGATTEARTAATPPPLDQQIAATADLARLAVSLDPLVRLIDNATYCSVRAAVEIASTNGLRVLSEQAFVEAWIDAIGDDGSTTASGSHYWWGSSAADFDALTIATAAVQQATRLLGRRAALSAAAPAMFAPEVTAAFVAAAGRALVAPTVRSRRGPLPGGIGADVATPHISLVDDGLHESSRRAAVFDDEGNPRQRTPLITAGSISGMLQSTATIHDGESSTGNAFRGSYKSPPGLAANTLVLSATATLSELRDVDGDLVVVEQLSGQDSGVSPVTGRIDIAATGYLLRGGEPVGAFSAVPISTTLVNVLRHVDGVGDDARVIYRSPALSPTIRVAPGWLEENAGIRT